MGLMQMSVFVCAVAGDHDGGPLLFVALLVDLVIGIIQAATSINEMTLSFVPKLVIVLMTFGLFGLHADATDNLFSAYL